MTIELKKPSAQARKLYREIWKTGYTEELDEAVNDLITLVSGSAKAKNGVPERAAVRLIKEKLDVLLPAIFQLSLDAQVELDVLYFKYLKEEMLTTRQKAMAGDEKAKKEYNEFATSSENLEPELFRPLP